MNQLNYDIDKLKAIIPNKIAAEPKNQRYIVRPNPIFISTVNEVLTSLEIKIDTAISLIKK